MWQLGLLIIISCFGAFLGSVLHVLLGRVHDRTVLWGKMRCDHCQRVLRPHHLVPVLSWVWLMGRCSDCGKRLHWQRPLIELVLGGLFLIAYLRHPWLQDGREWVPFIFETLFSSMLIFLASFDLRWKELPLEIIGGSAIFFSLFSLFTKRFDFFSMFVAVLVALIIFGGQSWISHGRWMGGGDPWMGMMIAAALGWPAIGFVVYITYLLGGIIFAILFVCGFVKRDARVPFAPWLAIGSLGTIWFGTWMETFVRGIL